MKCRFNDSECGRFREGSGWPPDKCTLYKSQEEYETKREDAKHGKCFWGSLKTGSLEEMLKMAESLARSAHVSLGCLDLQVKEFKLTAKTEEGRIADAQVEARILSRQAKAK